MYYLVNLFNLFILRFCDRHEARRVQTHSLHNVDW